MIVALPVGGLLDPLPPRLISGDTGRRPEGWRDRGQDLGGERSGLTSRHGHSPEGPQAACLIAGQPVAHGMTLDPQHLGHVPAGLGLAAGQQPEHVQPWCLAAIMVARPALLQDAHLCRKAGSGLAHGLFARGADDRSP